MVQVGLVRKGGGSLDPGVRIPRKGLLVEVGDVGFCHCQEIQGSIVLVGKGVVWIEVELGGTWLDVVIYRLPVIPACV